jgi:glycosyltransferase involved in cell wall biosynthesis
LISLNRKPVVFMMDLWAIVPYYTAYLSRALLKESVNLTVGSITYYLDTQCFESREIPLDPGLLNIVGRFRLPTFPRRVFKLIESTINLLALTLRFIFSKPDILHVQYLPMLQWRVPIDLWFVRFLQRRGTKVVLTVHDLLPHDTGERYRETFLALYRQVDAIICHSGHVAAKLVDEFYVPRSKINVIPHGPFFYDLATPTSPQILQSFQMPAERLTFLFQGIILPYKGVDLLLKAWQLVEKETSAACLIIAGTGPPELLDQLRTQTRELGLRRVNFHFRFISTEELVALYRAADVVVYPYRAVTTSGALATGLALGKAMVASDLSVFRELLTNEESALLIDPQDADQFAKSLLRLAHQPDLRDALSARIKEMQYGDRTWQSIAVKTVHTYNQVLTLAPTGRSNHYRQSAG